MATKEEKNLIKAASKTEWDKLAHDIIVLEMEISKAKNAKTLKSLKRKLKVWENEKRSRVENTFSMEYFMNKDMEIFETEYDEDYYEDDEDIDF
jgi:hypothetical protein